MRVDNNVFQVLNKIYESILLRPVDEEGIKKYSKYIPYKENLVRKDLLESQEYLNLKEQLINLSKHTINPQIKHHFIKGNDLDRILIDIKNKKVLVLSLVKNCGRLKTLYNIQQFIKELSAQFQSVKFGALTNNNTDKTVELLLNWQQQEDNIYIYKHKNEPISFKNSEHPCGNRLLKLAEYREKILKQSLDHFGTDFDYIIVFDSDIILDVKNVISHIIDSISINSEWSAISANNLFQKSNIHYDILALRLKEQPIDITQIYNNFHKFYGLNFEWNTQLYIFNDFVEVKSAFGGLTIYNANEIINLYNTNDIIYDMRNLPECTCEHIALDLKLKNKHYINSSMKLPSEGKMEKNMSGMPMKFLPRDAGFFSVFNFLVGAISTGIKAYPYFNKKYFLEQRNENKHFCYWTDSENSWMDFFEPIKYHDNDNEHINNTFLKYSLTYGEEAPKEFKIPLIFKQLLTKDKEKFQEWRNNTHNIYNKYIKFHPNIIKSSEDYFNNMFTKHDFVIGLHYRHPSHSVESGEIFLQQYYDEIDKILLEHQNAKIFLATDTDFGIMSFKYKYGDRIQYLSQVSRLPIDNILEWAYALNSVGKADNVGLIKNRGYELHQNNIHNNPNFNYYNMTKNLLEEVICLSKCNILINTTSNVSLALSYINPHIPIITI